MNLHTEYKTEEEYYKPIENIIGETVNYCGMVCKVKMIAKYVKPEHFSLAGFRCVYVLEILEPTEEELQRFEGGFLYANSQGLNEMGELINN